MILQMSSEEIIDEWIGACTGCGSAGTINSKIRCTVSSEVGMKRSSRFRTIDDPLSWLTCWHPKGTILEIDSERVR